MALSKIKSIYLGDGSVNDAELGHISTVTSNVQTQINNIDISTHTDPLTFDQESTPSNPASNKHKLYFKNDGNLYKLDSAGNEKLVGGDPEGVKTNAADIFTNFVKDMENHGRDALHTETGFVDELETAGDMVDASASSGMTYTGTPNSTNGDNYYANTPGATNQTADIQTYTQESYYKCQEWTNTNTSTSQITIASSTNIPRTIINANIEIIFKVPPTNVMKPKAVINATGNPIATQKDRRIFRNNHKDKKTRISPVLPFLSNRLNLS